MARYSRFPSRSAAIASLTITVMLGAVTTVGWTLGRRGTEIPSVDTRHNGHSVDVMVSSPDGVVNFTWVQHEDGGVVLWVQSPVVKPEDDPDAQLNSAVTVAFVLHGDTQLEMELSSKDAEVTSIPPLPDCPADSTHMDCQPAMLVVTKRVPSPSRSLEISGLLSARFDATSAGSTVIRTPQVQGRRHEDKRIPAAWYAPAVGSKIAVAVAPPTQHEFVQAFPADDLSGYEQVSDRKGAQVIVWTAKVKSPQVQAYVPPGYVRYEDPKGLAEAQRDLLLSGVGLGLATALLLEIVFWFVNRAAGGNDRHVQVQRKAATITALTSKEHQPNRYLAIGKPWLRGTRVDRRPHRPVTEHVPSPVTLDDQKVGRRSVVEPVVSPPRVPPGSASSDAPSDPSG